MSNSFIGYLLREIWDNFKSDSALSHSVALEAAKSLTKTQVMLNTNVRLVVDRFMQLLRDADSVRVDEAAFAGVSRTMALVLKEADGVVLCDKQTIKWLVRWMGSINDLLSSRVLATLILTYAAHQKQPALSCFGSTAFYHYLRAFVEMKLEADSWLKLVKAESVDNDDATPPCSCCGAKLKD